MFHLRKMIVTENSAIHMQLLPLRSINEPHTQLAVEAALTFFSMQKKKLCDNEND